MQIVFELKKKDKGIIGWELRAMRNYLSVRAPLKPLDHSS